MKESTKMTKIELVAEVDRLRGLINVPGTDDFVEAVRMEAAHQIERWGQDDRQFKTDFDWLWLMTYLAGKALFGKENRVARLIADHCRADAANWTAHLIPDVNVDGRKKYLHRIITIAAATLNWHRNRWPGRQP
jgi:hypothetical protein